MLNLISTMPERAAVLAESGVYLHDYGKQPRPGRKLGHLTLVESTGQKADLRATRLLRRIDSRKI
jgi:5-(carboxyamino)imidazole ribonucleotide synthase